MLEKVNLAHKLSLFTERWSPKLVGEVNDVPELLATTDATIKDVAVGAVRYAGSVGKLLG